MAVALEHRGENGEPGVAEPSSSRRGVVLRLVLAALSPPDS